MIYIVVLAKAKNSIIGSNTIKFMKTKKLVSNLLLVSILFMPFLLKSQDTIPNNSYGVWGAINLNSHSSNFKKVPECPSCSPGYEGGESAGASFGFVMDYPIYPKWMLYGKLFYSSLSAELLRTESTTVSVNGVETEGAFEHSFESTLRIIGFEPGVKYNVWEALFLNLGIETAYIFKKDYSQIERITKPTNSGTFLDANGVDTKSRERNSSSGELKSANSIFCSLAFSLSYQLPISADKELFLEPELSLHYGLTNIISDALVDKWKVNRYGVGIALKYSPKPSPPIIDEYKKIENIDTLHLISANFEKDTYIQGIAKSDVSISQDKNIRLTQETISRTDTIFKAKVFQLTGEITAIGVDSLGNEIVNPHFQIEEFTSNRLDPLLNYIFFDENSAELPKRYKTLNQSETDKFALTSLYQDNTIELYYNLLNIVGKRMTNNPTATLKIIGCNSDNGAEKNNRDLSKRRAESIKNYLTNNWNIDAGRLIISTSNLPKKASTPHNEPIKIQENQRVELYSDDYKILEPIFIEKADRTAYPPIIRFKPIVNSEPGIKNWELKSFQNSQTKNQFVNSGYSDIPINIDWNLNNKQEMIPKFSEPLVFTITVEDRKGNKKTFENQTLPIEQITVQKKKTERQGDYEIELFNLILFDFDKSKLELNNKKIVDFILSRIKPESTIEIIGYTDESGNKEYNTKLAKDRAQSIKKALNSNAATVNIGDAMLYDNKYPEGRFYCRTVEVIVKTKIK